MGVRDVVVIVTGASAGIGRETALASAAGDGGAVGGWVRAGGRPNAESQGARVPAELSPQLQRLPCQDHFRFDPPPGPRRPRPDPRLTARTERP